MGNETMITAYTKVLRHLVHLQCTESGYTRPASFIARPLNVAGHPSCQGWWMMKANFKRVTNKAPGKCQLKHHYRRAHAQVMGILELWAANDPERFVPARVLTIAAHSKKFKTKELYSKRHVQAVLRDLRAHNIISARCTRWRDYEQVDGFIVAKHETLCCHMTNTLGRKRCVFLGWGSIKPFQLGDSNPATAWPQRGDASALPQQCSSTAPAGAENAPHTAPHSSPDTAPNLAPHCSPHLAPDTAPDSSPHLAQDHHDGKAVKPDSGSLALVTVSSLVQPDQPTKPLETSATAATNAAQAYKGNGQGCSVPSTIKGCALDKPADNDNPSTLASKDVPAPRTIGQHFADVIGADAALLDAVTDGEIDVQKLRMVGASNPEDRDANIELLAQCTRTVLGTIDGEPWDGQRKTCVRIMDLVIKMCKRTGQEYPPGWLLVLKELQKRGGPCKYQQRATHIPTNGEKLAQVRASGGVLPKPNDWQRQHGYELCFDMIWRPTPILQAEGWIKAADGVWDKGA